MSRTFFLVALICTIWHEAADAAIKSCTFQPSGVAFGTFSGTAIKSTGTFSFTCTGSGNANYTVAFSTGGSGTFSLRKMSSGLSTLSYNLYLDSTNMQIWGDGTGGSIIFSGQIQFKGMMNVRTDLPVYGKLPAQAIPPGGAYSDTIVVTLTY
jgi:spore coat protein U-like protein